MMISTSRTSDFQISGSAISSHKNIHAKDIYDKEQDIYNVIYMDAAGRPKAVSLYTRKQILEEVEEPKEMIKRALLSNAVSGILVHIKSLDIYTVRSFGKEEYIRFLDGYVYKKLSECFRNFNIKVLDLIVASPVKKDNSYGIGSTDHKGIDIGAGTGTEVISAAPGTVIYVGYNFSRGNYIKIEHGGGYTTVYQHLSDFNCKTGDMVMAGQVIGYVGSTGHATEPHLHFEIWESGTPVDPMKY